MFSSGSTDVAEADLHPASLHAASLPRRWNSDGFMGSFVGLLSASASSCCANPRKALLFSGVSPKGRALLFQFRLQAHTERPVLPRRLNEIAFKLFF